ncbi:MAG TPA: M23 family metallopeptidase [Gemmatimonadaceae bacterium]|nr:M23 family metallopeptidase [Gemmatimonadaceae bacterium]
MTRALFAVLCTPAILFGQLAERPVFVEARVLKPPTIATMSDGSFLVYEVHVTNFEQRELTWSGLEAMDATNGATLVALTDTALAREMTRVGASGSQVTLQNRPRLGPGQRAYVYLFLPLSSSQRPTALRHRLTMQDSTGSRTLVMRDVPVAPEAAPIGPPLKGGNWLAANGPGRVSGHRRALLPIGGAPAIAQRFAIDYVIMDSAGSTFKGDRLKNESYYAEGVDAIAVADGIVVATKDSIPENVPGPTSRAVPITLETVGGNHVILDIGGRFAFYAHLKPGSLRVKVGDRVRKGEVLGLVGNSGNSTEPHLHFHLADGNSPLGAEGIPYTHETLEVLGRCQSLAGGCTAGTAPAQTKRGVMPAQNELVRFPR